MLKAFACCLTLLAIAIGGPADAQPSTNGTRSTDQQEIAVGMAKLPKLAGSSGQALPTAMEPGFRVSWTFRPSTSIPG